MSDQEIDEKFHAITAGMTNDEIVSLARAALLDGHIDCPKTCERWARKYAELRIVRQNVVRFVESQRVPAGDRWDGLD